MANSEVTPVSQLKSTISGCAIAAVIAVVVVILLASGAYYSYKASQAEFARRQRERRMQAVADVKAGRAQVWIDDIELLEMLANDPQCVANVTSVVFVMADVSDPRFHRIKELHNVKEVGFYDCWNADNVLIVAKEMESVEELSFEVTMISEQSIQSFPEFPSLNKLHFEQIVPDETIDELHKLLPNVNVETPYPASKER